MKLFNICACVCVLGAALTNVSADDTRSVELSFTGLPSDAGKGTVVVKAIRMQDLIVTPVLREQADSSFWIEVPTAPVILSGHYLSLDPPRFLEGSVASYSQDALEMTLRRPSGLLSPRSFSNRALMDFPDYPAGPHDRVVGYRDEDFIAVGPGAEPYMERGLVDMVVTGLVANECPEQGENSYKVVATASARDRAKAVEEINLQHTPGFDQGTVVEPHFITPNLMVHGGYIFDGDTLSVGLWIEDGAGNKIASAATSGPKSKLFTLVDTAIKALAHEVCHGKPWEGTITVEEHDSGHIPDAQHPKEKPGADFTNDLSVTCTFVEGEEGECTASTSGSLIGNGASVSSNASGTVPAYAGISVVNGQVHVSVGVFRIKGTQSASVGGYSSTSPIEVNLGPYSAKAPASGDDKSQSGSVTEGKRVISWSARR